MRTWVSLILWLSLALTLASAFCLVPIPAKWTENPAFGGLPTVLITVAVVLGSVFSQSRVIFICCLAGLSAFLTGLHGFTSADSERLRMTVFLASIYVPLLSLLFYHLQERGLFNRHGMSRMAIVGSAIVVMVFLPELETLRKSILETDIFLFAPISDSIKIPLFGALVFVLSAPLFFIRNVRESPLLGKILLFGVLFFMAALNYDSRIWGANTGQTAFILCLTTAFAAFSFSVMESSWRHANMDELTELPSRRAMKQRLASLGNDFVIAVLDIDHFKNVNDRYGHETGDQVLRFVASFLRNIPNGKAYRFGGEEFAVICENASNDLFFSSMEELRKAIASRKFILRGSDRPKLKPEAGVRSRKTTQNTGITITVSIGIAAAGESHFTPEDVLDDADGALYRAKRAGRNCIKVSR